VLGGLGFKKIEFAKCKSAKTDFPATDNGEPVPYSSKRAFQL
jgi:hypothetical protein